MIDPIMKFMFIINFIVLCCGAILGIIIGDCSSMIGWMLALMWCCIAEYYRNQGNN